MCITLHIGSIVRRVFPKEEKVEQEVPGGPHAPSCEELNPTLEQGKPQSI
jgi:hypothetical protein